MADAELSAAIAPLSAESERRERERLKAREGRPFEKEQKGNRDARNAKSG